MERNLVRIVISSFVRLPVVENSPRAVRRRIECGVVIFALCRQLNDVAIGIAQINRIDDLVIGDSADFHTRGFRLIEHLSQLEHLTRPTSTN